MATVDARPLLVVAAEPRELAGFLRHCHSVKRVRWPVRFSRTAVWQGRELVLVANGCGAALAGEACEVAWNKQRASAIISTGFCGALDPGLEAGSVVVADRVVGEDGERVLPANPVECARPHRTGTVVTADRVVGTAEDKAALGRKGYSAVEMEALAVGLRARQWGVPFYAVKAVTDLADEAFLLDFNAMRSPDGSFSSARILGAMLRRPRVLAPELGKLYHRSRLAAGILGEFLADCRF